MTDSILKIKDLKVHYPMRKSLFSREPQQFCKAVDGVSFDLAEGETLGLVGESGCGKSSLGKAIIRLVEPTSGSVELDGRNFLTLKGQELREKRANIQMIFQDPYGSLDPRMTVFNILAEPILAHKKISKKELSQKINRSLDLVRMSRGALKKYPHEFSGGQKQRVAIARALMLNPKVVIADEPVSALDVSVQAQILNLLKEIQNETKISIVFIAHNLAVVKYISDRIAVMYLGKMVELADRVGLYKAPQHPYTKALISAVPIPDPRLERERKRIPLYGELPSPMNPPKGCPFHTRCSVATQKCSDEPPQLDAVQEDPNRFVSCFEVPTVH